MSALPERPHCDYRGNDRSRRVLWASGLAAALFALALPACERTPRESQAVSATQPVQELQVDLSTPEDAVRSVLTCLRAELRAIADGDAAAAERYADLLPSLAAKETILRGLRGQMRAYKLTEAEVLKGYTANWGAVVAYYSEGLQFDQLQSTVAAGNAAQAYVFVPARGPDDSALLRVKCVRETDELWRVAGLDFQAPPVSRPASQRASQSTP